MFSQQVANARFSGERGGLLVEYAALFIFVVIAAIVALSAFGLSVLELYTDNADRYTGAAQRNIG